MSWVTAKTSWFVGLGAAAILALMIVVGTSLTQLREISQGFGASKPAGPAPSLMIGEKVFGPDQRDPSAPKAAHGFDPHQHRHKLMTFDLADPDGSVTVAGCDFDYAASSVCLRTGLNPKGSLTFRP
jgi:hypothetical protein